jgi:hypothetical protein
MYRKLALAACALTALSTATAQTLDFEDLTLGDQITVGDTRTTSGVDITGETFYWSDSTPTNNGFADVGNSGIAGGAGQELGYVNNINIAFDFGGDIVALSMNYGDQGGNENLTINGMLQNVGSLTALDGMTVDGVLIGVNEAGGLGTLDLTGTISSFSVGGQEFGIDNVTYTVPEPATLALLAAGLLLFRRR